MLELLSITREDGKIRIQGRIPEKGSGHKLELNESGALGAYLQLEMIMTKPPLRQQLGKIVELVVDELVEAPESITHVRILYKEVTSGSAETKYSSEFVLPVPHKGQAL